MPRARKPCSRPGCPELVTAGRCAQHQAEAEHHRGNASQRGYDRQHEAQFRTEVLRKDPVCRCDRPNEHDHGPRCARPSVHADHYPLSRAELVRRGMDPNDPQRGRGLCHRCHSSETARLQPGGWHQR